jgi:hypothetical protein
MCAGRIGRNFVKNEANTLSHGRNRELMLLNCISKFRHLNTVITHGGGREENKY